MEVTVELVTAVLEVGAEKVTETVVEVVATAEGMDLHTVPAAVAAVPTTPARTRTTRPA